MSSFNSTINRVRRDLEMLHKLQAENEVDFRIVYPKIRDKHEYKMLDFQAIWIDFRNEKARGTI